MRACHLLSGVVIGSVLAALSSVAAEPVSPAPQRAAGGNDPSGRERESRNALDGREHVEARATRRAEKYSTDGRVDLFVASSKAWLLPAEDDRLWGPAFALGTRIVEEAKGDWPLANRLRTRFEGFVAYYEPTLIRLDKPFRGMEFPERGKRWPCQRVGLIAPGILTNLPIADSVIISRGDVVSLRGNRCVVFVNGDFVCDDDLQHAVVIADGDIRVKTLAAQSVLIARGNIECGAIGLSTVSAGGTVTCTIPNVAPKDPKCRNTVSTGDPKPLGFITFFELSQVGVEAAEKDMVVRVTKLTDASPLHKAGVAAGDVVLKVDGKLVANAEELRRALRDATATTGAAVLVLRRGEKESTVRVPLPD